MSFVNTPSGGRAIKLRSAGEKAEKENHSLVADELILSSEQ